MATGANGTLIKKAHITELRAHCTGGSSCYESISQFVTDAYQGVLHRAPTTSSGGELPTWTATLTQAQSLGSTELLTAAQSLLSTLFNSSEYSGLGTTNAQFVTDLYQGYLQRTPDDSGYGYWLGQINGGRTRAQMLSDFGGSSEFQTNVVSLCVAFGGSGGLHYVLSDLQGSTRVAMNNNGSSSAVVARHDYLPFGEEIGSGLGSRSGSQGYGASDLNRWKYAMTERDATSGLDHTWWRKYESSAGRWTTPDTYNGSSSIANPQSLNRYSYVQNDPINFIDPSGLDLIAVCGRIGSFVFNDRWYDVYSCQVIDSGGPSLVGSGGGGGGVDAGGGGGSAPLKPKDQRKYDKKKEDLLKKLANMKDTSKCARFLSQANISLNDLRDAVNRIQAFDGALSTISNGEAGVIDTQDPDFMALAPERQQAALNEPVSSNFGKSSVSGASTGTNNRVYFNTHLGWGISSNSIFHEALHVTSGLGDVRLAQALRIRFEGGGMGASQAINEALRKNGCIPE